MTGIQIKGKSFRGALRYNLEKVDNGVAEILDHNFVRASEKSIMKEIQMIRVLKPNLQKYFYHTSINFPPGEDLPNDKMKQIANDYLVGNGFVQHQFVMFRHYDAGHPHMHILVSRIGYDGKVLSDSNDFARSEKVLRQLEIKYQLKQVISSREAKKRSLTKNEAEMIKRTNVPSVKLQLQELVKSALLESTSLEDFVRALSEREVHPKFNIASTGFVSGVSYQYKDFVMKGSSLGNDFKWSSIKQKIIYAHKRATRWMVKDDLYNEKLYQKSIDRHHLSLMNDEVLKTVIDPIYQPDSVNPTDIKRKKKRRRRMK